MSVLVTDNRKPTVCTLYQVSCSNIPLPGTPYTTTSTWYTSCLVLVCIY